MAAGREDTHFSVASSTNLNLAMGVLIPPDKRYDVGVGCSQPAIGVAAQSVAEDCFNYAQGTNLSRFGSQSEHEAFFTKSGIARFWLLSLNRNLRKYLVIHRDKTGLISKQV